MCHCVIFRKTCCKAYFFYHFIPLFMTNIIFFGASMQLTLNCLVNDKEQRRGATPNNSQSTEAERFCRVWSVKVPGFFILQHSFCFNCHKPKYIIN